MGDMDEAMIMDFMNDEEEVYIILMNFLINFPADHPVRGGRLLLR